MPFLLLIPLKKTPLSVKEDELSQFLCPYGGSIYNFKTQLFSLYYSELGECCKNNTLITDSLAYTRKTPHSNSPGDKIGLLIPKASPKLSQSPWLEITAFNQHTSQWSIHFNTDAMGCFPIWYTRQESYFAVTSELKSFCALMPKMHLKSNLHSEKNKFIEPFKNVFRVLPQTELMLEIYGHSHTDNIHINKNFHEKVTISPDTEATKRPLADRVASLHSALDRSMSQIAAVNEKAGVMLSSGIDSSLTAAWLKRYGCDLTAYTLSTHRGSEVKAAQQLSRRLGIPHREIVFPKPQIAKALTTIIRHNETHDGLSVETLAQLYALVTHATGNHQHMITGYGADLIFGSMAGLKAYMEAVGVTTPLELIHRSLLTGEFSPFYAWAQGIQVFHAYWEPGLIQAGLDLGEAAAQQGNDSEKFHLRNFAYRAGYLTVEEAFRRKKAITVGTRFHEIFSKFLGVDSAMDYETKTQYCQHTFLSHFSLTDKDHNYDHLTPVNT